MSQFEENLFKCVFVDTGLAFGFGHEALTLPHQMCDLNMQAKKIFKDNRSAIKYLTSKESYGNIDIVFLDIDPDSEEEGGFDNTIGENQFI